MLSVDLILVLAKSIASLSHIDPLELFPDVQIIQQSKTISFLSIYGVDLMLVFAKSNAFIFLIDVLELLEAQII